MQPKGNLPDFLIIGAQRCGTTSFYRLLCRHPFVNGAARKEVHYFDRPAHFHKGEDWYRSFFPAPKTDRRARLVTGESTPYYFFHPLSAKRAARTVPDARLILLLRNPIDRAYSHYQHGLRQGHEVLPSFEQALDAEAERLAGEREKILNESLGYFSSSHQFHSYASRGIYVDQLREWRAHFGENSLLVIKSEDYYRNPSEILARAQRHLGLPHRELDQSPDTSKDNLEAEYPPMRPETRRRLAEYFAPHNERLYDYLGVDFDWE